MSIMKAQGVGAHYLDGIRTEMTEKIVKTYLPSHCVQVAFNGCGFLQLHLRHCYVGEEHPRFRKNDGPGWETSHTHAASNRSLIQILLMY